MMIIILLFCFCLLLLLLLLLWVYYLLLYGEQVSLVKQDRGIWNEPGSRIGKPLRTLIPSFVVFIKTFTNVFTIYFRTFIISTFITALHVMQTRYCDEKSVRPSVCLSVIRVYCDKTVERSVQIYIPYERTFSLVFWEEKWLVGGDPFYLKFWIKVTALVWNRRFSIYFR